MKTQVALAAALLGAAGCTKQEVVTQTGGQTETNVVLTPKRGIGKVQETNGGNGLGHATGILQPPEGSGAAASSSRAQKSGNAEDDALAQRVRVAISTGSTGTTGLMAEKDLTPIEVEAKDGVVTLKGKVETEAELRSVIAQVQNMPGVKGLNAEITIGAVDEAPARTTTVQGNANETLPGQKEPNPPPTPRATE